MQYTQAKSQRSVMESRRYEYVRPRASLSRGHAARGKESGGVGVVESGACALCEPSTGRRRVTTVPMANPELGVKRAFPLSLRRTAVWTRLLQPLLALTLLFAASARAQAPLDAARRHFQAGLAHAERGDWRGALAAFTAAYELAPRPRVLFNLAGAQLRCGMLLSASTNYRRLLTSGGSELTSAQRDASRRQLALIEERVPRLRVRIEGLAPDDRIHLDRTRLYPEELDRDMWIDPGTHVLTVMRTQGATETRTVVVVERERRVLLLSLPPRL